jgi:LytS/YehU family sensor histidine kinase
VQILVENAIKHGIVPLSRPGTVWVRARRKGPSLLIEVKDDGVGLRTEALSQRGGLGLRALRERLNTRYDKKAVLEIRTAPGAGFDVTVTLPVEAPAVEAAS